MTGVFLKIAVWGWLLGLLYPALSGCSFEATDKAGVFVPNVEGTYDRTSLTTFCDNLDSFDPVTDVVQAKDAFILGATTNGFEDYTGTIDEAGAVTLDGAGTTCTGSFVDSILAATCKVTVQSCGTDPDTGAETCTAEEFSCSVSYKKR